MKNNTRHTHPRYSRQTVLPEIGEVGQNALEGARVLMVGAGGLGCPALMYLAGAGVGHIGIVDHDTVEEHNLHRQPLYTMADIGKPKSIAAAERLHALNPYIEITPYAYGFTSETAERLVQDYDLIIDGCDNFAAKYLINDVCVRLGKPFIYGAVLKYAGQVALFNAPPIPPNTKADKGQDTEKYSKNISANLRTLFPAPPEMPVPNCAENGVIGAVAGIIGNMQALKAIKYIVSSPDLPAARNTLIQIDLQTLEIRKLDMTPLIGRNEQQDTSIMPKETCPALQMPQQESIVKERFPDQVIADKAQNPTTVLVDVREQEEWDDGHIDGAVFFPLSAFMEGETPPWNKDTPLVIYCRSGQRSLYVAQILAKNGYTDLANMTGGILAWNNLTLQNKIAS